MSVRRPTRIKFAEFPLHLLLRTSTFGQNQIDLPTFARYTTHKNDLFPIGRPARQACSHRWVAELKTLAAIHFAPPQTAFREYHISYPLSILGKIHKFCRDS